MYLWKRILHGMVGIAGSAIVVVVGAMMPPSVVPPVSTVVAVVLLTVGVAGGASILRIRRRYLAVHAVPERPAPPPIRVRMMGDQAGANH